MGFFNERSSCSLSTRLCCRAVSCCESVCLIHSSSGTWQADAERERLGRRGDLQNEVTKVSASAKVHLCGRAAAVPAQNRQGKCKGALAGLATTQHALMGTLPITSQFACLQMLHHLDSEGSRCCGDSRDLVSISRLCETQRWWCSQVFPVKSD